MPRKTANETLRQKSDPRCQKVEQFFRCPDGQHSWADWLRLLIEEQLVTDAATLLRRNTADGQLARVELLDGALIKPIVGYDGAGRIVARPTARC